MSKPVPAGAAASASSPPWVLTLPYRLRDRLARDHALGRALLAFSARTARAHGIQHGPTGTVTVIHRVASGLPKDVRRMMESNCARSLRMRLTLSRSRSNTRQCPASRVVPPCFIGDRDHRTLLGDDVRPHH